METNYNIQVKSHTQRERERESNLLPTLLNHTQKSPELQVNTHTISINEIESRKSRNRPETPL